MGPKGSKKTPELEIRLCKALYALKNKDISSIRAAARLFEVDHSTLTRRLHGGVSQSRGQEMRSILTNAEEDTVVRWLKKYSIAGGQLNYTLLKDLAVYIRNARVTHASSSTPKPFKSGYINDKWIERFKSRHPEIQAVFTRQLEASRRNGASYEPVKRWFDAVASLYEQHQYKPSNIWNFDESGFGVGEEQAMKVLTFLDSKQQERVITGKQEWVTDIECISAEGESLPPLLIFKGDYLNTRWLDERSPEGWHFATTKNGWTSNDLGFAWLSTVFEPLTREKAAGRRRLLIADGHGSHIQAKFIAHCMENDIDLMIMPPHCSHILQPLDVGVFAAFKRYHTVETHAISRLSSQRIPRLEWVELLSKARVRAMSKENILSGWRATGLWPATPMRVLRDLPKTSPPPAYNAPQQATTTNLDLSLLQSSPPEPVELLRSNKRFTESLRECPAVVSPVKRYAERMTRLCESQNATIAILSKEVAEQAELLRKRKKARKGKRVRLEGVHVYTTKEVLQVAREEEAKAAIKRPRGRPKKVIIIENSDEEEDEDLESSEIEFYRSPVMRGRRAVISHIEV
jgi:hypothetical protein